MNARARYEWLIPWLGALLAATVCVARQSAALVHPEVWAEGGTFFFANVHNLGLLHALTLPQAGDFGTFTSVAAWVTNFAGPRAVAALMAIISLAAQVLPVGLLLTRRAQTIARSYAVRAFMALLIVLAFHSADLDLKLVNAQWWIAGGALLVLLIAPARTTLQNLGDGLILLAAGLTGPFAFALAPAAWLRSSTGARSTPRWQAWLLTGCAVLQAVSILVISPHDAHDPAVQRFTPPHLGASPQLFIRLVGGRVLLGSVLGQASGLRMPLAVQLCAFLLAIAVFVYLAGRRANALLAFLWLAGFVLAGGLALPASGTDAWEGMATPQTLAATPYFLMIGLAVQLTLLWLACDRALHLIGRAVAGLVLAIALGVSLTSGWKVPVSPGMPGYNAAAAAYSKAAPGTPVAFPIAPVGWAMTLVRH